jgi:sulfatase maturation enzyme AslB (radical SAM superfamily)
MNRRIFCVILLPTSDCNVACDYCFERKEPHRFGDIVRIRPANHTWFVAVKLGELCG